MDIKVSSLPNIPVFLCHIHNASYQSNFFCLNFFLMFLSLPLSQVGTMIIYKNILYYARTVSEGSYSSFWVQNVTSITMGSPRWYSERICTFLRGLTRRGNKGREGGREVDMGAGQARENQRWTEHYHRVLPICSDWQKTSTAEQVASGARGLARPAPPQKGPLPVGERLKCRQHRSSRSW